MKTLADYRFQGDLPLIDVLATSSYGSLEQAIASLTLFSHKDTVAQTECKAIFRVIRASGDRKRGNYIDDERLFFCDNQTPGRVFDWANGLKSKPFKESQYNHVYEGLAYKPEYYTCLANICVTPAFLAKLTDTNDVIKNLLQYRVFDLYDFLPKGYSTPSKPRIYDSLVWAPLLAPVPNVKEHLERGLKKSPRSRAALSKAMYGWLFG